MEPGVAGQGQLGGGTGEAAPHRVGIGVLHGDPELGGGLHVDRSVGLVRADEAGVELGEAFEGPDTAEGLLQRAQGDGRLLLDVQTGQHEGHRVAPPAEEVEAHLHLRRRPAPPRPRDPHPVAGLLLDGDGVEACHHVGVGVLRAGDLVEQLGGHRAHRHFPARAFVLGDDRRAVVGDLGDREPRVFHALHLGEEGVVAPRGLGPALDDVAGHHRTGQPVPVGRGPSRGARRPGPPPGRHR